MKREYELIRSGRKSVSAQVTDGGRLVVRAPLRMPLRDIESFLVQYSDRIDRMIEKQRASSEAASSLQSITDENIKALADKALSYIPERVEYFAKLMGLTCGNITIRCQKTRWGSCSSKRNLSFNCLLMCMAPEVIDYVVVHELCHIKHMDHSADFWRMVERYCPDHKRLRGVLKAEGEVLMLRVKRG